ncbi:MAG: hypothetical protein Q9227_006764 [Pyrenula ochraceoflavens]
MQFEYQSLNANEIRLLRPRPQAQGLLSYDIIPSSLVSKPNYVALSYTWGAPGSVQPILLNGRQFRIRRNLCDALQQIQSARLVRSYLWVDAICINQGESQDALSERSEQITLMTQIYEQAANVLVWLGNPENDANNRLAFLILKNFERDYSKVIIKDRPYRPWWWPNKPQTAGADMARFLQTVSPSRMQKALNVSESQMLEGLRGIEALWNSPWWTRTWVFQESTIPEPYTRIFIRGVTILPRSAKVRFLYGDQETRWSEISLTCSVATSPSLPGFHFSERGQQSVNRLMQLRSQRIQNILRSFLDILQIFRCTECLDPRDKVYAPLCLASEDVRQYIRPNYATKTVLDVYMDVVKWSLAQRGHELDFLGLAVHQEEAQEVQTPQGVKSNIPSWVPNFAHSLVVIPIPKIRHVPTNRHRHVTLYDRRGVPSNKEFLTAVYCPLGVVPSTSFIKDCALHTRGVFVDYVKDQIPTLGLDVETIRASGYKKGREWAMQSKHKYFTGESFSDAIQRTNVLDLTFDEQGRPSERGGKADTAFLRTPRPDLSVEEFRRQMNMRNARSTAYTLRTLGLSRKLYLLLIPNTAKMDDTVWALTGGQTLYVLRPVNQSKTRYSFVGECYAHGLMDGEILRWTQSGAAGFEDVVLG